MEAPDRVITTIAGTGNQGFLGDGGPAAQAWLFFPEGVAVDTSGNVFFADTGTYRVREVNTSGIVNTVAGNGMQELSILGGIGDNGPATSAGFNPGTVFQGVAVDSAGNLYIAGGGVAQPAFFPWPNNQAVATHQDYMYAAAPGTFSTLTTVAAKPGEVIILWGTGFGATTPATLPGDLVPSDQVYSTSTPVTVTLDQIPCTVYGAALAPGFVGE